MLKFNLYFSILLLLVGQLHAQKIIQEYSYEPDSRTVVIDLKNKYRPGIVIFSDVEEIPQEVVFIPHKRNESLSMQDDIEEGIKGFKDSAFCIYFQAMKWTDPDLLYDLFNSPFISGNLSGDGANKIFGFKHDTSRSKCRVIFGILDCDTTINDIRPNYKTTHYEVELTLKNNNFKIHCISVPNSFGYVMRFLRYNTEQYKLASDSMNQMN